MNSQTTWTEFCSLKDKPHAQWKINQFCEWCAAQNLEFTSAEIITIVDNSSECLNCTTTTAEQTWQKTFFKD